MLLALAHAKAYLPELVPAQLADGFPEFNIDGTPFGNVDYLRCVRENHAAVTQLGEESDLTKYQAAYSEASKCLSPPHKQVFTPGVNSSTVMIKESVFESLDAIQWLADEATSSNGQEKPAQDDPA